MNKPWSKIRKELEQDFLCDSLKGRVRYFSTRYNKAHDRCGRVCILVDNIEKINMHYFTEDNLYHKADSIFEKNAGINWSDICDKLKSDNHESGIYMPWDFGNALDEFFTNSIDMSLTSGNYLVRILAIFDRRVGKRTLKNLKSIVYELPEWLQYFYNLRFESEGI